MIVAVDVGSGSVRAGLVAEEGIVHVARRTGALAVTPGRLLGLDLMNLWARIADALAEVAVVADERGVAVDALTCTAIRYATVWSSPESEKSWSQQSWANLARADRIDVDVLQASLTRHDVGRLGGWPTALSLSSRIASARRWDLSPPEESVPLSVSSWILGRMGAVAHIDDVSWADGRVDARNAPWALPRRSAGAMVGEYNGVIAGTERWRGARLAVSPPDTVAALHALGGLVPGDAVAIAGTTTPVVAVAADDDTESSASIDEASWLPFAEGLRLAESNAARTGESVRAMSLLLDERGDVAVERIGTVRSFLGQTLVAPRRLGESAPAQGIEFQESFAQADRGDLMRSAIEANAWATDTQLRRVEHQAGRPGRRFVCGGQTRSAAFLRLLAAAGGRPVEVVSAEVTLLRAAAAAAGARGAEPSVVVVEPDIDVAQEPQLWARRWWERYEPAAPRRDGCYE
ncbi:FGGY-family carbohydrate kinase [Microbacterium alcoholitolerans]|uniref:FGGY-family carbohydrate kinase n=1 Tax=Microbacterium sp. YY-04 TaxID=3421637 RepID=UPI003D181005